MAIVHDPKTRSEVDSGGIKLMAWVWSIAILAAVGFVAYNARTGVGSPRVANVDVTGAPRPFEFLFGWDYWVPFVEIATAIQIVIIVVMCVVAWRRRPGNPIVLMTLASTGLFWLDPIMNWSVFAVYNPQLWHFPEDWPLVSMSPTVEPLVAICYAPFILGPFFPAMALLRRLQLNRSPDAFVWRHPLITLAALIFVIGFVFDMLLEVQMILTGIYVYSQVPEFGSIFVGTPFQFPLLWQSTLVTIVMIAAGVLCYRDDTGRTQAEKLAQNLRLYSRRPALATFVVMFSILNFSYLTYGSAFALFKFTHFSTVVACPWPFPEAKVYDPQGYYEREGQSGPYFVGKWATWASGQPEGRPVNIEAGPSARCSNGTL